MAWKRENIICNHCGHYQTAKFKKPNHTLHLIMSVVTLGLWLVILMFAAIEAWGAPSPKCNKCNKRVS